MTQMYGEKESSYASDKNKEVKRGFQDNMESCVGCSEFEITAGHTHRS